MSDTFDHSADAFERFNAGEDYYDSYDSSHTEVILDYEKIDARTSKAICVYGEWLPLSKITLDEELKMITIPKWIINSRPSLKKYL